MSRAGAATVLVVGGAGYIGSHMSAALLEDGYGVVTLDDLSRGHRELVPGGAFVQGGCGDAAALDRLFAAHRIDAVMHFAAWALVGESVARPLDYYRNNVGATAVLLDRMLAHGVKNLIFSSTCAVYGEPERVPIDEEHPTRPTNPYGRSKLAAELMLADAARAHGLSFASLRYFNAAGAHPDGRLGERHDPETHLIPLVLQVASGERERIAVFGSDYPTRDGTCVRDYVHVCDLAQAHLLALERLLAGQPGGIYNLGSSRGHTVREVIELARAITGHPIPAIDAPRRPGDPAVLVASPEKARRELGWQPRFEALATIVETAWAWHRREAGLAARESGAAR
jgi:UDP-glucose 4-epimerase